MGESMDSLRVSYHLELTEPASGGCCCSTQGTDVYPRSALGRVAVAVMGSGLLSCKL